MCGKAGGANLLKSRRCSDFSFTFSISIRGMAANKGGSAEVSQDNQCCLCDFKISDPCPEEGQLCGLLSSMWDHIEECHPEEEDWFDETFSSMFLDV